MKFEFSLPRNTKLKSLNMVIKKLSFVYGGLSEEKGHYRLEFDIEEVTE